MSNDPLVETVNTGIQACKAYGRPDLGERLQRVNDRLADPTVQVVVVGEFKQGKSSLINALLSAEVCPVDDDIATSVPTAISHGPTGAAVLTGDADDPNPTRSPIPLDDVPRYATELGQPDDGLVVRGVEVTLERNLLAGGLVIVDTPGVGGLGSAHATATLGALSLADAAIFVTDASQELTGAEMEFLHRAQELCPRLIGVMTKTDFYPNWREVAALNAGHLARAGMEIDFLPTSSALRREAIRRRDAALNEESGFAALVQMLRDDIVGNSERVLRNRAARDVMAVASQLGSQFEAELASLQDPENGAELVERLRAAQSRSEQLKTNSARWQVTLNDAIGDLTSDIDYDFRQRVRIIIAEAEGAIDEADPADNWDEFEAWLVNRVSQDVVANYTVMAERSREVSAEVASHFDIDGAALLEDLPSHDPSAALARVRVEPDAELRDNSLGQKGLTAVRGSYSGVLMFSMLPGFLPVLAPLTAFALPVGLLLGRKALKDEKERQLVVRRSQGRQAVRRYCDEVSFQVQKDSKDNLRRIQRQLRDHYTARAEELSRSTTQACKAAQAALKQSAAQREKRTRDAQAELNRLRGLAQRAEAVLSA